jgi:hypothetical protein
LLQHVRGALVRRQHKASLRRRWANGAVTQTPFRRAPGGTSNHSRRTHSSYDGPFRSSRLSMAPVKKLLNVVGSCEIRGRLRCNAASIGYRNRIRKALVHSRVTLVSWNRCQEINLRMRPSRTAVPSGLAAVAAASRHCRRAGQGRDQIRFGNSRLSVERSPLSFRGAAKRRARNP